MTDFPDPFLRFSVTVPASVEDVWDAWTTESGVRSFFAPACNVALEPAGPYEIFFRPDAPEDLKGGEGNRVLSYVEPSFLSFTWNAPPEQPTVRPHKTVVTVRLEHATDPSSGEPATSVTLTHLGWPPGDAWDACREYFANAWSNAVLPNLVERFESGPIDWENR